MLIRIGDEKHELIDAHLGVLATKLGELINQNEAEPTKEVAATLRQVVENMPHKCMLYSSLFGLLAA